jgi:hypothetical protein
VELSRRLPMRDRDNGCTRQPFLDYAVEMSFRLRIEARRRLIEEQPVRPRHVWRLSCPYFRSEEKWSAWVLVISIIVLNLSMVGMNIVLNFWNPQFFNSPQDKDWQAFFAAAVHLAPHRSGSEWRGAFGQTSQLTSY